MASLEREAVENKNPVWNEIGTIAERSLVLELPFLLEEKDPQTLESFFRNPPDGISTSGRTQSLKSILLLLSSQNELNYLAVDKKCMTKLMLFLSEQTDAAKSWSSTVNSKLVAQIVEKISAGGKDLKNVLRTDLKAAVTPHKTLFYEIMVCLKTKLRRERWKYFPAAVSGFYWILTQMEVISLV